MNDPGATLTQSIAPENRAAHRGWTVEDIPDQRGRTALVTGATSGLGFLTAQELARRGAHMIMTARDRAKGERARRLIQETCPDASTELRMLDLADLDQVKSFAQQILADGIHLDVLVNNAGIMMVPRTLTKQGHELQFAVNHLAHFALTLLLLPTLASSPDARVVTISSDLHRRGRIHFEDLTGDRSYGRIKYYAQSKFADVLFALELDRRLRRAGSKIRSVLAHPGYAATNLQMSGPSGLLKLMLRFGNKFLAQPAEMGVLPQLYAATAAGVASGEFYGPDSRNEKRGHPTLVHPISSALDEHLAKELWSRSEALTGVSLPDCLRHSPTQRMISHPSLARSSPTFFRMSDVSRMNTRRSCGALPP